MSGHQPIVLVAVVFARGSSVWSDALRVARRSKWSHCALAFTIGGQTSLIEARWPRGVVLTSAQAFERRMVRTETVHISMPDPVRCMRFAKAQIGRPFDAKGALGLRGGINLQEGEKWHSASLVAAAMEAGGYAPLVGRSTSIQALAQVVCG